MKWYFAVLRKYADFSGRARRTEYWMFSLVNMLVAVALSLLDVATGLARFDDRIGVFSGIYSLAILVPSLAVLARRLHDTGRSGWWILVGFVPFIGAIVLLVFTVQDSQPGQNPYGPSPKEAVVAGTVPMG